MKCKDSGSVDKKLYIKKEEERAGERDRGTEGQRDRGRETELS